MTVFTAVKRAVIRILTRLVEFLAVSLSRRERGRGPGAIIRRYRMGSVVVFLLAQYVTPIRSDLGAKNRFVGERRYTIDGNERPRTTGQSGGAKAEWSGNRWIITSWFEIEGRKVNEKEVWELADDQKTLILIREHMDNRGKTTFKRQ